MRKKLGASVLLAVVALVALAPPATAHVTVSPEEATKGGFTKLAFSVPNEEDAADTVQVAVMFSDDHPLPFVSVKPKAGWTVKVTKAELPTPLLTDDGQVTEAVTEIVWSGGKIAPGEFDEFEVSVGPLPKDIDVLVFPAVQTYSDGTTAAWSQQTFDGQPEPERPAPQLDLVTDPGSVTFQRRSSSSTASNTRNLAIAATALALAGIGIGGLAYVHVRRFR